MLAGFLSENLKGGLGTSRKRWQYIIKADLHGLRCKNVKKNSSGLGKGLGPLGSIKRRIFF
jgi:hypothetical protein